MIFLELTIKIYLGTFSILILSIFVLCIRKRHRKFSIYIVRPILVFSLNFINRNGIELQFNNIINALSLTSRV